VTLDGQWISMIETVQASWRWMETLMAANKCYEISFGTYAIPTRMYNFIDISICKKKICLQTELKQCSIMEVISCPACLYHYKNIAKAPDHLQQPKHSHDIDIFHRAHHGGIPSCRSTKSGSKHSHQGPKAQVQGPPAYRRRPP
jgi:hypothetical protein